MLGQYKFKGGEKVGVFQRIREKRMLDSNSLATTLTSIIGAEKITETEAMNIPSLAACVEFISSKVRRIANQAILRMW